MLALMPKIIICKDIGKLTMPGNLDIDNIQEEILAFDAKYTLSERILSVLLNKQYLAVVVECKNGQWKLCHWAQ